MIDKKERARERILEVLSEIRKSGLFCPTLVGLLELAGYPEEASRDKKISPMYNGRRRISTLPDYLKDALTELLDEGKIVLSQDTWFSLPPE